MSHEVAVLGYDATGPLRATRGGLVRATWLWREANVISVDLVIPDLYRRLDHAPTEIPVATLHARFGGGFVPRAYSAHAALLSGPARTSTTRSGRAAIRLRRFRSPEALPAGLVLEKDGSGAARSGELGRIAGSHPLELSARSPLGAATTTVLVSVTGPPMSSATPLARGHDARRAVQPHPRALSVNMGIAARRGLKP